MQPDEEPIKNTKVYIDQLSFVHLHVVSARFLITRREEVKFGFLNILRRSRYGLAAVSTLNDSLEDASRRN